MELTRLMQIAPLWELLEEDEQQLRRLDWHQIRASVVEYGSCLLGKRKWLLPSKSEANLVTRPLEEARRDATVLMALCRETTAHHLALRSVVASDGDRAAVVHHEGGPGDDLFCFHDIQEWSFYQQFQQEIGSWDWDQLCAKAEEHTSCRLGRR